jgi:molecular chaperone DnaK (HSP70)
MVGRFGLLQFLGRTPVLLPAAESLPPSLAVTPQHKTREILTKLKISTVTVVADFLAHIRKTTLESIKRTYWMEEQLESKVEWILTVPALWDDHAKYRMVKAARMAGFGDRSIDFELISEPECGATYSLDVIQQHHLSVSILARLLNSDLQATDLDPIL